MINLSRGLRGTATALFLALAVMILLGAVTPQANTQAPSDLAALSYQAFSRLAAVYRSGGQAPDLVARLNAALGLIQEARLKRSAGDQANAGRLEDQARSILAAIMNQVPDAQQKAQAESTTRAMLVFASIPLAVAVSTFLFYSALRTWRWYDKTKLFEMRIVEKKKTED